MMSVPRKVVADLTTLVRDRLSAEAQDRSSDEKPKMTAAERKALAMDVLKSELKRIDTQQIQRSGRRLDRGEEQTVIAEVMAETTGLGQIELLLADPTVEDIHFTRFDLGFTEHTDGSSRRVDGVRWASDAALREWIAFVANTKGGTGRSFNAQQPILVLQLGDGLRLAATCEVSEHTSFSLRRNTLGAVTLDDLQRLGMFPVEVADLLRALTLAPEMRVVIVGATGAGKTTLLRAMLAELDPMTRVGIVEDTREVGFFDEQTHPNVEQWETREANLQGEGRISMDRLVEQLFRYRVEKLIVGEVRSADAAAPMIHAMNNGRSSITTTHSYDARSGLEKLAQMTAQGTTETRGMELLNAKETVASAVDIAIHVDRGEGGRRYVSEIAEVSGFEGGQFLTQSIYTSDWTGQRSKLARIQSPRIERKLRRGGYHGAKVGRP